MRILVAEDDAVSRTILRHAVENLGHECLSAEDGEQAWQVLRDTPEVDVVISDWMMPGLDGPELCRRVREGERNGRARRSSDAYTYFIFLTALGDRDHLLQGLEVGADDYLSKPLDPNELQVRLISAARVTELHRRLAFQNEELEDLNRRLFEESRQDPLTSLGNRLRLGEDLGVLEGRASRYGHLYSAVLCDVDFFKAFNDRYGHLAGDEVLKRVARTISGGLRGGDSAYRYGGEEFLIVLSEQPADSALVAAKRLRRSVEELGMPHEAKDPPGVVTISVGVAALSGTKRADDLLREADTALYRAKQSGRNRVVLFETADGG